MSNRFLSTSPDLHAGSGNDDSSIDLFFGVEVDSASGAIGIKEGYVFITDASAAAMTLANPTAGMPSAGGDDGRSLTISNTTTGAHTITAASSNKINGNKHVITFSGAVTDFVDLVSYNGVWRVLGSSGVTLHGMEQRKDGRNGMEQGEEI
jgi:hypothetical protein